MRKLIAVTLTLCLVLALIGCGGAASSAPAPSAAESGTGSAAEPADNYPEKPIEIIVPYKPGASTDTTARIFANVLTKYLPNGQSVVVVNKEGSGGSIGVAEMLTDMSGYTLAITTTNSPLVLNPLTQDLTYTYDDIAVLMQLVNLPSCLNVSASSEWQTAEEWFEWVKAHPGEFSIGGTGVGGAHHVETITLGEILGTEFNFVPFNSVATAQTAVLQGTVNGCLSTPTNYDPAQTRILWTASADGVALYPEIPTLQSLGVDFSMEFSIALVAPAAMPENRKTIVLEAFEKAIEDPELIELFKNAQFQLQYKSGEELDKILRADIENSKEKLEALGLLK